MKPGDAYRSAAELLVNNPRVVGGWSCWAIEHAIGVPLHDYALPDESKHELVQEYENTFRPEGITDSFDKGTWGDGFGETEVERNECRVLALCFMAAIADSPSAH